MRSNFTSIFSCDASKNEHSRFRIYPQRYVHPQNQKLISHREANPSYNLDHQSTPSKLSSWSRCWGGKCESDSKRGTRPPRNDRPQKTEHRPSPRWKNRLVDGLGRHR